MSRFRTGKGSVNKTVNRAGGEAFTQSPKLELVSLLLTSFVKDKFYESAEGQLTRLEELVKTIPDSKFVAKAAIYARKKFGMRSITHALIGELVHSVKGQEWTKNAVAKAIHRPDDMLEILGYYLGKYKKPIPNSLKKGLRIASVTHFDAYQLAKYKGGRSNVKLVDLCNLVHPKAPKELQDTFKKLMKGELKSTGTWEAKHTKAGQAVKEIKDEKVKAEKLAEMKKDNWTKLIKERKLGYFALLKNLRNILEQAPEMVDEAAKMLVERKLIEKSLVLPFRFNTALKEIEKTAETGTRVFVQALDTAMELSLANVPKFDGKTLVVLDESGSMQGEPIEIGSIFAAVLYKTNDADLMSFSERARYRNLNAKDSVTTIARRLQEDFVGSGTNFHSPFTVANQKYDRMIFLSDMQGWIGYDHPGQSFEGYKMTFGANPHVYSFDLNGYGDMQFPEKQVYCIAGWSDKVFEAMKLLEQDRNALVKEIEKVEL